MGNETGLACSQRAEPARAGPFLLWGMLDLSLEAASCSLCLPVSQLWQVLLSQERAVSPLLGTLQLNLLHRLLNRRHRSFSAFLICGQGCSQVKA